MTKVINKKYLVIHQNVQILIKQVTINQRKVCSCFYG